MELEQPDGYSESLSVANHPDHHHSPYKESTPKKSVLMSPVSSTRQVEMYETPPKRVRLMFHEDLTKKDLRERKVIAADDESPERFELDYEVLCTLGSGAFGIVKKCRNRFDGELYAVKIMNSNRQKNLNEVRALASISQWGCSYVVRYHHCWIENKKLYMAMEYCHGNLKKMLTEHRRAKQPISERTLWKIIYEVLCGMKQLHQHGLVHLDIKPQNILISRHEKYKLGDLSLCRRARLICGQDINEGDCKYMARELLNNHNPHEVPDLTKADVYSFGITLYELITLEELPNNGAIWHELRDGGFQYRLQPFARHYNQNLISMVAQMLEPRFDRRPSTFELIGYRCLLNSRRQMVKHPPLRHFSI